MAEQIIVQDDFHMLTYIGDIANQLESAWVKNWTKDISIKSGVNSVLIAGMGGSAIAGHLARELFLDNTTKIEVWSDYELPGWADEKTLLVAISFSGDTEETINSVKAAIENKMPIITITSGGKLAELAKIHNLPLLRIDYTSSPRAAIGCLYGTLLVTLSKLKLVELSEEQFFAAIKELDEAIKQKLFPPKAEELAINLTNKVPVIYAANPLVSVAKRYVNQLNENSKTIAFSAALPELSHNTLVGIEFAVPEKLAVVLLESRYSFSRNNVRFKIISDILTQKEIAVIPISVDSRSPLAEQLLMIHFGDLLSFYLAGVYGVDPTPVENIDMLKSKLAKVQ